MNDHPLVRQLGLTALHEALNELDGKTIRMPINVRTLVEALAKHDRQGNPVPWPKK